MKDFFDQSLDEIKLLRLIRSNIEACRSLGAVRMLHGVALRRLGAVFCCMVSPDVDWERVLFLLHGVDGPLGSRERRWLGFWGRGPNGWAKRLGNFFAPNVAFQR